MVDGMAGVQMSEAYLVLVLTARHYQPMSCA